MPSTSGTESEFVLDFVSTTKAIRWPAPLTQAHWLIVAAGAVITFLIVAGGLSLPLSAIGFVALAGAALLASRLAPRPSSNISPTAAVDKIDRSELQAVLGALPDPVIALDAAGAVVALNAQALTIAPALRLQQPVSPALRIPSLIEAIRRAAATGEPQQVQFWERVPVERCYAAHVAPLAPAAEARSSGLLLLTFHDLTPQLRIEQMRADFVANASHELRTPLAALSGFIDTLQGPARNDPAARERFLDIMSAEASRMARLIDDLLSLSRIELDEHIRPDTPTELVSVVRQVVDSLQPLARERDVDVTIAAPAEPVIVRGDRDELIRVFENLVENALKYAASGRRVDIEVAPVTVEVGDGGEVKISIRDYGPGIAPEHVPRLTERFYRIDIAHSRAEGGTGLGLALVKHILNCHRGRLSIASILGAGSTFTVYLPLMRTPDASASG
jgi:two-component system phosphate regulon sensor histidine kinase PhoR